MADEAIQKINELYSDLLNRQPRGFATSSMGKFDGFREWFADEFQLGDWRDATYAVGSASTAHNFGSRWTQNNSVAGRHLPLGIAFLSVPKGEKVASVVDQATHTNKKFVDGTRTTSFENIILFAEQSGDKQLRAQTLLARPGSSLTKPLQDAFPGIKTIEVIEDGNGSEGGGGETTALEMTEKLFQDALTTLTEAGLATTSSIFERAILSLAAKPFLILAGLSGSGKTVLGLSVAKWLSESEEQLEIVPVGADWTSTHSILGYADALDATKYNSTPTLDLILRAISDPNRPYFIILDEMNLSHVERYFSDFLSGIESREPITLHGVEGGLGGVPSQIILPRNLLIIGTVNIDETTYMFSPKVIDRANVIEFFVDWTSMRDFLLSSQIISIDALKGKGISHGASILSAISSNFSLKELSDDHREVVEDFILSMFTVLDGARIPFGFRTAAEMIRYLVLAQKAGEENDRIRKGLDAQMAQRILSRLSGDASSLWPAISGLVALLSCQNIDGGEKLDQGALETRRNEYAAAASSTLVGVARGLEDRFPITIRKLVRILERLEAHGYVTAFEA